MSGNSVSLDDAPLNGFHLRVAAYTTGGMFCDGYILGIVGYALTQLTPVMHLNAVWNGLIGASALIGIFFGSLVFGWVTDRLGRQVVYMADLVFFILGSVLQFFVANAVELFILRLIMGFAVGADYALGPALLAEFVPRKQRGPILASLNAVWTVGYVVSMIIGYGLQGAGPGAWRWMLASSAVPAIIVLLLRLGTPESPRWLIRKGRVDEARRIVKKYIGENVDIHDLLQEKPVSSNYKKLFSKRWRSRTAFSGLFWLCQVVPYFAIFTFVPQILKSLNMTDPFVGSLVLNIFLLIGAVVGVVIMNKLSRRFFTIWSFVVMGASLLILGIWPSVVGLVITCFAVFAFVVSAAGNLETVYPAELFPTDVRASGVGVSAAISRVGAAAGTFALPVAISAFGLGPTMLIGAAILFIGMFISMKWAPETRTLSLAHASLEAEQATSFDSQMSS
ncbi:MFS transporter [Alicyclobacillus ferrooxydans]|uniref:MFS transporter n=1 Tax=Alicyclobacillus ferrooxydans TaxID=471514 RepID=A0A0P9CTX6_9BACL|nr:MFS transporter [Alicyclobacillus ferrooxydans]KPV43114.1 MFS transporter [Alicyclobacillus ferrooxydans]